MDLTMRWLCWPEHPDGKQSYLTKWEHTERMDVQG